MNKFLKKFWGNLEQILSEWFSFLGWVFLWSIIYIVSIYEIYYAKNNSPGFIYLKISLWIILIFTSILLILYIFKKCFLLTKTLMSFGKSKLLLLLTIIAAIALSIPVVLVMALLSFTQRIIPGL